MPAENNPVVDANEKQTRFEANILPHLDAAYNLARWLTRSEHDARDVLQDACLRAFKFLDGFHGTNSRSWLLAIVRNAAYSWLKKNRHHELLNAWDEETHPLEDEAVNPHCLFEQKANREMVLSALDELPVEFREITILRELEGMSYKEIADITGVPMGTVMSRLARARKLLHKFLTARLKEGTRTANSSTTRVERTS